MRPTAAACGRLKELIRQAERGEIDPRKAAAAAFSIARAALKNVRHGVSNEGVPYSYDEPKYGDATTALVAGFNLSKHKADQPAVGDIDEFVGQVTQSGMAPVLMTKLAEAMSQKKGARA